MTKILTSEHAHLLLLLHGLVVLILLRDEALHICRVTTYVRSALFHLSNINRFSNSYHRMRAKLSCGLVLIRVSTLNTAGIAHDLRILEIALGGRLRAHCHQTVSIGLLLWT